MPTTTTAGGITLAYETYGDPADAPLLMVSGFGSQLISWPRSFCQALAAGGRFVIAYDNRDCGLSTKLSDHPVDVQEVATAAAAGGGDLTRARQLVPYLLSDMADDGLAVLDGLGIDQAHVLGASMGAMIGQTMAIAHPRRVLSLTSMMSTTGEPEFGQSRPEALEVLLGPPAGDRATAMANAERTAVWRSRRYPGLQRVRELAGESFDRDHTLGATNRQMGAIIASGSRADGLRALRVPTLVIHGRDDTLIDPSGGERTAQLIPGARLMLVDDMGHDRPVELTPLLCEAILAHTQSSTLSSATPRLPG